MIKNFLKNNKSIIALLILILIFVFTIYKTVYDKPNKDKEVTTENTSEDSPAIDTDGDTIPDEEEINTYKTDSKKKDSDNDGLDDGYEIKINSNPLNNDSDGDGLLDGKAQYVNNKKVAPADSMPTIATGPKGIWQKQIAIEKKGNIPYYLTDFREYNPTTETFSDNPDVNWEQLKNSDNILADALKIPYLKTLASKLLTFRLDNGGVILHSQTKQDIYEYLMKEAKENLSTSQYAIFQTAVKTLNAEDALETWQKQFGYNQLFDEVFRTATNNNMRSAQLYFKDSSGNNHVLWLWRGDYLVMGSGAEMGLYKKNTSNGILEDLNIAHWDAVDFEVPMTLNLYNYYSENNIEHIFSWKPTNKQWWITGFNPNSTNIDVTKQVIIGTVNLKDHKDMYDSMKKYIEANIGMKNFVIFDDSDYTVWINWYDK